MFALMENCNIMSFGCCFSFQMVLPEVSASIGVSNAFSIISGKSYISCHSYKKANRVDLTIFSRCRCLFDQFTFGFGDIGSSNQTKGNGL